MPLKETQRSVYKSMQGKEVDMHKLMMQNEMTPAVGNTKVNARGDELGPGGKVVRKREDIIREADSGTPDQRVTRRPEPEAVKTTKSNKKSNNEGDKC